MRQDHRELARVGATVGKETVVTVRIGEASIGPLAANNEPEGPLHSPMLGIQAQLSCLAQRRTYRRSVIDYEAMPGVTVVIGLTVVMKSAAHKLRKIAQNRIDSWITCQFVITREINDSESIVLKALKVFAGIKRIVPKCNSVRKFSSILLRSFYEIQQGRARGAIMIILGNVAEFCQEL